MKSKIDTANGFKQALKLCKEEIYSDLITNFDCGPFDGGCVAFANSLKSVLGGEVMVLIRSGHIDKKSANGKADHAALMLNGKLYDFDGPLPPTAFMKRFSKNEFVQISSFRPIEADDLPEAVRDHAIEKRIANLLHKALNADLETKANSIAIDLASRASSFIETEGRNSVKRRHGIPL